MLCPLTQLPSFLPSSTFMPTTLYTETSSPRTSSSIQMVTSFSATLVFHGCSTTPTRLHMSRVAELAHQYSCLQRFFPEMNTALERTFGLSVSSCTKC